MNWWENLFAPMGNPGTTVPIPPGTMLPPNIPFKYGLRDKQAGDLHSAIFGTPYIPTQFDEPNTFKPGAVPGQMDVAPKPPVSSPPMMGRQPSPAAMPMPGALPPGQNPPGAMGMGDLPGAMTPPAAPSSPARTPFDWGPDASLWAMLMQAGQGMMQPSHYGLGGQLQQGLAGATEAAQRAPMQKLQKRMLEAQVGKVEGESAARSSLRDFALQANLPTGVALSLMLNPEKAADILEKYDPAMKAAYLKFEEDKSEATAKGKFPYSLKIAEATAGKAPAGYRWGPDGKLETIPGGPATHISADVAGRLAMAQTAMGDLAKSRDVFLKEWGAKDITNAQIGAGDVGRAQRNVTLAIEAALRTMTGAAAPDSEVRKYEGMFMPKSYDTLETRKQKLALLEGFMQNAIQIATQGRGALPAPTSPQPPTAPATRPAPGKSGTLPGGIKWSQE